MKAQRWLRTTVLVVSTLLGPCGTGRAQASPILYHVSVNTMALSGQSGYLDFQFNPRGSGALPATATVSSFTSLGTLISLDSTTGPTGDVSGSLASSLTLSNSIGSNNPTLFNDFFQGFNFGNSLSFDVMLSGAALDNPLGSVFGSTFSFSLYQSDPNSPSGFTPLLTTDLNGNLLAINVSADGSIQPSSQPIVTVTPLVSSTPEPSSFLLFASLLPTSWLITRGLRRSRTRDKELRATRPESL